MPHWSHEWSEDGTTHVCEQCGYRARSMEEVIAHECDERPTIGFLVVPIVGVAVIVAAIVILVAVLR